MLRGPIWPDSATMSRSRSGRLGGMQTTRARWMCLWRAVIRSSTGSREGADLRQVRSPGRGPG
eukprot:6148405-Prymnesium_polylepis.1